MRIDLDAVPSVTYDVKIDEERFWHAFSGGWSGQIKRTGDSWYHLTLSRYTVEGGAVKDEFTAEEHTLLLSVPANYYHFHWYDPKPDARRAKTFEKRFKKSKGR